MADGTRAKAGSRAQSASASASPDAGDKQHHGDNAGHSVAEGAERAMAEVKQAGSDLVGAVCDNAVSMLDAQRGRAADQIAAVGEALRRSAQSFDSTSGIAVTDYADRAAERIEDFADTMRNRSWSDLAGDAEDFARRWPLAFAASAIGIGFIAGRFLLSSAERANDAKSSMAKSSMAKKPGAGSPARPDATNPEIRPAGSAAAARSRLGRSVAEE
jgi:hypothetical protein